MPCLCVSISARNSLVFFLRNRETFLLFFLFHTLPIFSRTMFLPRVGPQNKFFFFLLFFCFPSCQNNVFVANCHFAWFPSLVFFNIYFFSQDKNKIKNPSPFLPCWLCLPIPFHNYAYTSRASHICLSLLCRRNRLSVSRNRVFFCRAFFFFFFQFHPNLTCPPDLASSY